MRRTMFARTTLLFIVLSALDFTLTWLLLRRGSAAEANPVAAWWLTHFGWLGLGAFKAATVVTFVVLVGVVARRRPALSRRMVAFACAAVAIVVVYSGGLAAARPSDAEPELELEPVLRRGEEYRAVLLEVSAGVAEQRLSLAAAAECLAATSKAADPAWLAVLHTEFPGLSDRHCLAATVAQFTVGGMYNTSEAAETIARFRQELKSLSGADVRLRGTMQMISGDPPPAPVPTGTIDS
ncbi:MAG: DUF5658 family protein [Gemmataceae bacterium]